VAFIAGVFSYVDHMMVDEVTAVAAVGCQLGNAMGDGGIDPAMDAVTPSPHHVAKFNTQLI